MLIPPVLIVGTRQLLQTEMPFILRLVLFLSAYFYITRRIMSHHRRSSSEESPSQEAPPSSASSPAPETSQADDTAAERMTAALAHTPISEIPRDRLRGCFPWSVYYLQTIDYRSQAIICRGNLRSEPTEAYERVRHNVEAEFGNRFLVVLQEGFAGKPFFALVPNPAARRPLAADRPDLAIGLALMSVYTLLSAGAYAAGVPPERLLPLNWMLHPEDLLTGLPYAAGLLTILAGHELSRYAVARWHQLSTSLPYFIPVPFALGTFGAITQLKQPVPNRTVLFDLSVSGPLVGSLIALLFLVLGLFHSDPTAAPVVQENQPLLTTFHQMNPTHSLLLGMLASVIMGGQLEPGQLIDFHPLAFAGWIGLVVMAFNIMPVGQLDGGHLVHAVYGQKLAATIGWISRLLALVLALTIQPWLLLWVLLLFFISAADEPALNDVTELSEWRDLLGLVLLTFLVLIILPVPPPLQLLLGLS